MHRLLLALALPLLAAGCANTMNGSIDDESVGAARDAIFDEVEVGFAGYSVHVLYVAITGVPDACEAMDAMLSTSFNSCDDYCEDMNGIANDYLGRDVYWTLGINLWPEDDPDVVYDHGDDLPQDEFYATISRDDFAMAYDPPACEEACEDFEDVVESDAENSKDGVLEITSYEQEDTLQGTYDIEFGGDDFVTGRVKATYCDFVDLGF